MARLHVDGERMVEDAVVITDEDHHYLTRVLRLGPGDAVTLFDGQGGEAEAELVRVGPRATEARVLARRRVERPKGPHLTLVQALARGEKLDLVVQKATELGVHRIIPVTTSRSLPTPDLLRSSSRRERWQKIAREAARQCGRGDPPAISGPLPWAEALAAAPQAAARFCLHTGEAPPLAAGLLDALAGGLPLAFAVGPEGGLTDDEVACAEQAGFARASLGPFVLRTETVPAAVLGACRILAAVTG